MQKNNPYSIVSKFFIPMKIYAHPKLSIIDGFLFSLIRTLSSKKYGCSAKNADLASVLQKTESTIEAGLKRLRDNGLIYDNGKKNHLREI